LVLVALVALLLVMVLLVAILYLGQLLLQGVAAAVEAVHPQQTAVEMAVLVVVLVVIIKVRLPVGKVVQATPLPFHRSKVILVVAQPLIAFMMPLVVVALEQLELTVQVL
jgi:hypothetical protein